MSRSDSNSPQSSPPLPRRRFLQAMTAALPAAVAIPKPGRAFSSPASSTPAGVASAALAAAIAADPRFAEFDRLASAIVDLDLRQEDAFAEYDNETIA